MFQKKIKSFYFAFFLFVELFLPLSAEDIERLLNFYNYEKKNFPYELKMQRSKKGFLEYNLNFTNPLKSECKKNDTIQAFYFEPKGENRKFPAVIILHSWNAKKNGERKGYNLAILEEKPKVIDPISFAKRIKVKKLLMLNGAFDFIIPKSCVVEM